jgi:ankyrin repeat protein
MLASELGHIDIAILLVESGAKIDLRNNDGNTARAIAFEKGEMEIYRFLVENGAYDFGPFVKAAPVQPSPAPNTVAQSAPTPQTNIYVQPSVPIQSYDPPPAQSSQPSSAQRLQQTLQEVNKTIQGSLQNGKYKMSGRKEEISFAGIANSGSLFFKDSEGKSSRGTYTIRDDRITMNILGRTFFYTIISRTSFTGHGETWYHSGF